MAVDGFDTQIKNHRNFSWLMELTYDISSCHKEAKVLLQDNGILKNYNLATLHKSKKG